MQLVNVLKKIDLQHRLQVINHLKAESEKDSCLQIMTLHVLRLAMVLLVSCLWVAFTLATGFFTVGFVPLLGVAIGGIQFLFAKGPFRFYLPSALILTLVGGVFSNVLAGLAFFSSKMGVSFWQVLSARRFPEDIQMLSTLFLESLRQVDLVYYSLAMTFVIYFSQKNYLCGRNAGKVVKVQLVSGRTYRMGCKAMNYLLAEQKVKKFERSDGWAVVGEAFLRGESSLGYSGPERRFESCHVDFC